MLLLLTPKRTIARTSVRREIPDVFSRMSQRFKVSRSKERASQHVSFDGIKMKYLFTLLAQSIMKAEHHEIIVCGGGTAGLFAANKLKSAGVEDVVILEARPGVGGRIQTTRDDDESPMFNDFAWRVSEVNHKMIALCKELDINLIPQFTPKQTDPSKEHGQCKHGPLSSMDCEAIKEAEIKPNRPPLSDFAKACLDSASAADAQDRETGYAGRSAQVSKTNMLLIPWFRCVSFSHSHLYHAR